MNVLAVEEEKLNILRKSNFDGQRTINLLLIANNEKKHYAAIKTSVDYLGETIVVMNTDSTSS